jgi:hypothetical protein
LIRAAVALSLLTTLGLLAGCGLQVQAPDLFALTRTGQGNTLTVVVNDSGTIRCNSGKARMISSARLITARDLSDNLAKDAGANLRLPIRSGSTYKYKIRMQQGTITFSDRDTARRPYLAQAELFAIDAAQQVCGLSG